VQFLLTEDEADDWEDVSSDAEAKAFIELFWARRNPQLGSGFNPFRAQFEARVRYADEEFGSERLRGAMSDRARVLYLLGPPHYSERRQPTETVTSIEDTGGGTDEVRANAINWAYDPQRLPEDLKAKGSRLLFIFYEERPESNYFVLDRSHQEATMSLRALSRAPEVYVLHPDLEEVPKPVSVPGGQAASAGALAWLDAGSPPLQDALRSRVDIGMADGEHAPVWVHLELPDDQPRLDALAGRVLDPDGEVLSTFQTTAEAVPAPTGTSYHLTFPLGPGRYRLEVAGAAAGDPKVVLDSEVEVPEVPTEGTWMSEVFTGLVAEMEQDAMLGEAYSFGGWHLRPYAGGEVSNQNELSYLGFVVRPPVNDAGEVNLEAKVTLKQDGKRLGSPFRTPLQASKLTDDLWMYGNAINLEGLPAPGEYTLEFEVEEPTSGTVAETVVTLPIVE
jgi:GWxTD domain-containing protein